MLNTGKKFRALRDKKKYSNSCVVRKKKFWTKRNETKNHNPPFKLNGRSLIVFFLIFQCPVHFVYWYNFFFFFFHYGKSSTWWRLLSGACLAWQFFINVHFLHFLLIFIFTIFLFLFILDKNML